MSSGVEIHYEEWGEGPPVLALHGLGLESSSFTGLARGVAALGLRMLAADLPGFGKTPAPKRPLTPAVLAEPVIELARRLDEKPIIMGMSLGARVALEAALREPDLFRGVVMLAPPLPRREHRWIVNFARLLSPGIAERIPIERAWPWLKAHADRLENELEGGSEHDWFLRASRRTIYYMACPATRWAFISAARELALDPAFGRAGVWARLQGLRVPSAFVWGDQDRIIDMKNVSLVEERVPAAFQIHVGCAGHFDNGPHFQCMERGAIDAVELVESVSQRSGRWTRRRTRQSQDRRVIECVVGNEPCEAAPRRATLQSPVQAI
jgi:pimeloyl-ACP methyl ester carboxylesterase